MGEHAVEPAPTFRGSGSGEPACDDFEARLQQAKLESLKELAYGASHEINNPLANIAARAQYLLQDEGDPERRRALVAIHRQAMRAHEMIADLMLFARPPRLAADKCRLGELVERLVDELREEAAEREIALHLRGCERDAVEGDPTQLAVALKALIVNSIEAIGAGGNVWIEIAFREATETSVEVVVRDDGPGISAEVREHLFDPFYSGREAGRGLGFGLSKCWRIVTEHGGRVEAPPHEGPGAVISVLLPGCDG